MSGHVLVVVGWVVQFSAQRWFVNGDLFVDD